ncbi:metallophosphoesterase family protein [Roseofilum casamattae]|uniref:Metallophosphoesterase n=1 Tax=Roseofilum casamattae BLCC-M143 TaxID=3022442 RepID=A0ABT7BUL0_9CYAN|nr:metallophosphoesterase [Roseofilum casamattae]MDJ1182867.1 metallophosphoesterase [Roseofilum casamattae BLCC-M143]
MKIQRRQLLTWGGGIALGWAIGKGVQAQRSGSFSDLAISKESVDVASDRPPLLRFVSVADTGTGAQGQYAVAAAMTKHYQESPYELVVLAGDNIYNDGEIEKIQAVFEEPYAPLLQQGVPFYACLGNHDIRTDNGVPQTQYPLFNMGGQRYYTWQQDPVQFFALDTNHNANWEEQLPWLDKQLGESQAPWKIVFGHHQIYSSAHYGVNDKLIKLLTPLFKKHGVQLYINGHEHVYERTYPIDGTTYLICGAGAGVRDVGQSQWTAHSASQLSFAAYEVYGDRIVIQAIGTDSQVFDRGAIAIG